MVILVGVVICYRPVQCAHQCGVCISVAYASVQRVDLEQLQNVKQLQQAS